MADIEADVIIVGSGISGALLAAKLAQAGVKVAILEAGARVDRAEARQRFWNAPVRVPECPYPPTPEAEHPISNDPDYWYRQAGPNKFKSTYLKVVGGTTWHWLGTCLRFVPNDFRLRTAHGRGLDWPISYDELEPFYSEAEHEIGVAGDSRRDTRIAALCRLPDAGHPADILGQGLCAEPRRHGVRAARHAAGPQFGESRRETGLLRQCELHPDLPERSEIRRDRASVSGGEERRGRPCRDHGYASRSRRRGPRHRHPLQALGRQRRRGEWQSLRARGARDRDPAAAAALAQRSDAERGRQPLRPGRPQSHGPSDAVELGACAEPVWPYRGPLSTSSIENFRHGAFRKDRPAMRIEIGNDGWAWPKGAPVTTAAEFARQGLRGRGLDSALRDQASATSASPRRWSSCPTRTNRVTLDPDEKDMYGVPLPRLAYRLDAYVQAGLAAARAAHAEIFDRLGATEIEHRDAPEGAGHIMGTARMGNDPKSSVVDRDLSQPRSSQSLHPRLGRVPHRRHGQSHADHRRAQPCAPPGRSKRH